jgi:replicative DNA helicase
MPDLAADRTLPHNLEAERSLLGAILIRNEAINQAVPLVAGGDFFRDAHRIVYETMIQLSERGQAIDLVTLKDELARNGRLETVGGPAYVASLVDGVPRALNVEHYARILKEKSTLRRLIFAANRILSNAYEASLDPDELLDSSERAIFEIAEQRIRGGFVPLSTLVEVGLQKIELAQKQEGPVGVPTGFRKLDEMLSGLQRSDLVLVAARPSMGKTSFVLNIAQHVGAMPHRRIVGFFSLEMSSDQLFLRLLTAEAQVDAHRLRGGYLTDRDYTRIFEAVAKLSETRIFVDDTAAIGVLEMRAKARRLKAEHGLDLLVIDYLQLMQGHGRFDNRQQELASISRSLKGLAKELDVPVVALSQLSRAPEARADRRPQLSDLRESGALEQDADVVMLIFREEMYERTPDNENKAEIIVAKQRNGPTGSVELAFLKQFTRFENIGYLE